VGDRQLLDVCTGVPWRVWVVTDVLRICWWWASGWRAWIYFV